MQNVCLNVRKRRGKREHFLPVCQGFSTTALRTFCIGSLSCRGLSRALQEFSSDSGLSTLDASSSSSAVTNKNRSRHCQVSLGGRGGGHDPKLGTTGLNIVSFISTACHRFSLYWLRDASRNRKRRKWQEKDPECLHETHHTCDYL